MGLLLLLDLLLLLLLLLLGLLLSKGIRGTGAELAHVCRGRIDGGGIEGPGEGGSWRAIRESLRDVCLRAIAVVCKRITAGGGDKTVRGTKRVGRPSSLFGVRTTDSIHGTLDGLIRSVSWISEENRGGRGRDEPSSCQDDQSRRENTVLQRRSVCRPLWKEERERELERKRVILGTKRKRKTELEEEGMWERERERTSVVELVDGLRENEKERKKRTRTKTKKERSAVYFYR